MNLKILQDKDNKLFNRKEVKGLVEADSNPKKQEAEKIISETFSKPVENIALKKIQGKFGRKTFLISANVYDSPEDKNKTEPKKKIKKQKK